MREAYQRDMALVHLHRGRILERVNRLPEAVAEYRQAVAENPLLREASSALSAYYQRFGMLTKAADVLADTARLNGDFLSFFNVGCVLLDSERLDEARHAFLRCLSLCPDDSVTLYQLAVIALRRQEYRQALEYVRLPIHCYPDDWELYRIRGVCHLHLGEQDDAAMAFAQARHYAPGQLARMMVAEHEAMLYRLQEIGPAQSLKERLYIEAATVVLGSAQDDGLTLYERRHFHFTYPDIGVTLRRFVLLAESCEWPVSCVAALDRTSLPLAGALAQLCEVPLRPLECLDAEDAPLLVLGMGREPEVLDVATERIPHAWVFCLGMCWPYQNTTLPDVVGVVASGCCSLPWEAELRRMHMDRSSQSAIATCLMLAQEAILHAALACEPEPTGPEQCAYYAQLADGMRFARLTGARV